MRIALTGNPNSGKTTMFNALTGQNEKVGNWAGVTVDKKEYLAKKKYSGKKKITVIARRRGGLTVSIKDARYSIDVALAEAIIVK